MRASVLGSMLGSMLCAACHADVATIPAATIDPYGSLQLQTRSIVMSLAAPYDTLQLHATPYSIAGSQMTTLGAPTYAVSDTSIAVSATGLVTAKTQTSNSYVVVTLRDSVQNVTHVDTAFITVTNVTAPIPLASLSLHPAAGDSAKLAVNDGTLATTKSLVITATGTGGEDLSSSVQVRFASSDPSVASVSTTQGVVKGFQVGTTVITATTTWYGVTKSSSLTMQIGNPIFFAWSAVSSTTASGQHTVIYQPTNFTIGVGGVVGFLTPLFGVHQSVVMDVIFDDSTAVQPVPAAIASRLGAPTASGNVYLHTPVLAPDDTGFTAMLLACFSASTPPLANCMQSRYFPRAGSYTWHSNAWGLHGTITVTQP
jgi:hypothetical protein